MNRILVAGLVLFAARARAFTPQVNIGGRQVTLSWTTPGSSSSTEVAWGTASAASFDAYPNHSAFSASAGATHSRTLRRLAPGTYYYRARSSDGTTRQDSAEATFVVPRAEGFPLGDVTFDNPVLAIAKTPTTWYVGGYFGHASQTMGTGVAVDSSTGQPTDTEFPEVNGAVLTVLSDGVGGLYLGGAFTAVGGLARNGVAHLLPDHGVDPAFSPVFSDQVSALALSGGVLYVGGAFTSVGGVTRNHAAAVNATSGALTAWDPNLDDVVSALTVVGGQVWAGGFFGQVNGGSLTRSHAAAFDPNTGTASAFNPGFNDVVRTLATDGTHVFFGGDFTAVGTTTRNRAAAFLVATSALVNWDPNFDNSVLALSYQNSVLYVGGLFFTVNGGTSRGYAAAIDPGTGTATAFAPVLNGPLLGFQVSGSTVYGVGGFNVPWVNAAAFDSTTGALVSQWNPQPNGSGNVIALLGGDLYLGGHFSSVGPFTTRPNAAAIDATTGALTDWNPAPDGVVFTLQASGNEILMGGSFTHLSGAVRNSLGSVDGTTGAVSAWDPNVDAVVESLVVTPGLVYGCGQFLHVNGGTARMRAAAFDRVTGVATAWAPELDGECFALTSLNDIIYLGGNFTHAGSSVRNFLAAMDTSGNLTAWDPDANAAVSTLIPAAGNILAGGYFTTVNGGLFRPSLASLDPTTGTADAFTVNTSGGSVTALALAGSTLYLAGAFGEVQGQPRGFFAAVNLADGTLLPFTADGDARVRAIYPDCGAGGLAVGGDFLRTNLAAQQSFAIDEDPQSCSSDLAPSTPPSPPDAGVDGGSTGTEGGVGSSPDDPRRHLQLLVGCTTADATWSALSLLPLLAWLSRRRVR